MPHGRLVQQSRLYESFQLPKNPGEKIFFPLFMCESLGMRLGESGEPVYINAVIVNTVYCCFFFIELLTQFTVFIELFG